MQPKGPGSSIVEAARPMRPNARKSPPSLMTIAESRRPVLDGGEQLVRMQKPILAFGGRGHRVAQLGGALLVARAQLGRPIPIDRCTPLPAAAISALSAAAGDAQISTTPRRLSRNSPGTLPMRTNRAAPNTAGEPKASWKSSRRPTVSTTSASPITAPRMAPTTEGCVSGTSPRLSPVSR